MSENNILGVILAGGKSKRFGSDKSLAKLAGRQLIDHIILKIENNFNEILVICNKKNLQTNTNKVFTTKDIINGHLGPLVGVLTAMNWIKENKKSYNWIFTFPCDTPFFDKSIISEVKMKMSISDKKLFFIKSGNKRHNIFGLWSLELFDQLKQDIEDGSRKVEDWADKIGKEIINIKEDNEYSFLNINSVDELFEAEKKIK